MIIRYKNQKIILRKNLLVCHIVKIISDDKFLISYYENNKFKYELIQESDIVDNKEYEIIKERINKINRILDS